MRNMTKLLLASVAMAVTTPAMAAPTLTSAAVTGPSGTVWNTTVDSFYTLFVQRPLGNLLNPNDNFTGPVLNDPNGGAFDFQVAGDGWPTDSRTGNSDPFYTLTLNLTEGSVSSTLTGVFDIAAGTFLATSGPATFSDGIYSLDDFNWSRGLVNLVGSYSRDTAVYAGQPIGSRADYQGAFSVSVTAVPEPATWGLMILGFGAVGGVMRPRRKAKVSFA